MACSQALFAADSRIDVLRVVLCGVCCGHCSVIKHDRGSSEVTYTRTEQYVHDTTISYTYLLAHSVAEES
eukprot:COSAG06_NODE_5909_length_3216_cov_205.108438_4_plen_70_part_00